MHEQLDELDRAILRILREDGRIPAAQIAERVGLSRPAVAERMEKLERTGVILGTTAVVHPDADAKNVTAFISARRQGALDKKSLAAFRDLMRTEDVIEVHSVAGDDCYLMKVRTDSILTLNKIVSRLSDPPLAMSTRTTIVMETHCEKVGGITRWGGAHDER